MKKIIIICIINNYLYKDIFLLLLKMSLNAVNKKWSQPMQKNLGVPTARAAHGMCAVGTDLVIFGGRDTQCRRNDLHIFSTGKLL